MFQRLDWRQSYEIFPKINLGDRVQPGARVRVTALAAWCGSPGPWAGLGAAGQGHKGPLVPYGVASVTHPACQRLHLQMLTPV